MKRLLIYFVRKNRSHSQPVVSLLARDLGNLSKDTGHRQVLVGVINGASSSFSCKTDDQQWVDETATTIGS